MASISLPSLQCNTQNSGRPQTNFCGWMIKIFKAHEHKKAIQNQFSLWVQSFITMVSCQKGPTRHAYAWQIGPFWKDTLDIFCTLVMAMHCVKSHKHDIFDHVLKKKIIIIIRFNDHQLNQSNQRSNLDSMFKCNELLSKKWSTDA